MIERFGRQSRARGHSSARGWLAAFILVVLLWVPVAPAMAADYEPEDAGNPLRIASYIIHPVGVVFDYLILRPMYWVGSHEPFRTIFGRQD